MLRKRAKCPKNSKRTLEADSGPELNVSNVNALHHLGLLGYTEDECEVGIRCSETAENFLDRVLLAPALNPADAGIYSLCGS